jgi:hypothetical protein
MALLSSRLRSGAGNSDMRGMVRWRGWGRAGGRAGGRAAHPPRSMRSAGVMRRPARSALTARRRPLCDGGGKGRPGGAPGAQYTTSAENASSSHSGAPDVASATRLSECAAQACARRAHARARGPAGAAGLLVGACASGSEATRALGGVRAAAP